MSWWVSVIVGGLVLGLVVRGLWLLFSAWLISEDTTEYDELDSWRP